MGLELLFNLLFNLLANLLFNLLVNLLENLPVNLPVNLMVDLLGNLFGNLLENIPIYFFNDVAHWLIFLNALQVFLGCNGLLELILFGELPEFYKDFLGFVFAPEPWIAEAESDGSDSG